MSINSSMGKYYIYIISDSVGETGEHVAKAAAGQFKSCSFEVKKYPYMEDLVRIQEILEEAQTRKAIVVFTTVLAAVRHHITSFCTANSLTYIDVMDPLLATFKTFLGEEPANEPGTIHKLDEKYFNRVEAVEFAVKYDDGKDPRGVKKADVVILGVSRTSKTPLSMYLAHKNIKVANIPLVPEVPVPKEVYEINPKKIVGLKTNPHKLNEIREERLKALGLTANAIYANMDRINEELVYAEEIMKKIGCPVIDVSSKAIEETANIILQILMEQEE